MYSRKTASIIKTISLVAVSLGVGILIGGYLFSDTQPRSFLALQDCKETCLQPKELMGLMTSIFVQKFPSALPDIVIETDKTVAIRHPAPQSRIHYVVFPKKDIKNLATASEEDRKYLLDTFAVLAQLIRNEKLTNYQVITNGPGYQETTYLHFHLRAE